jgi:hypothetical protein
MKSKKYDENYKLTHAFKISRFQKRSKIVTIDDNDNVQLSKFTTNHWVTKSTFYMHT